MAATYIVPKVAGEGPRDLGIVQKASSCNDPEDRDGYTVTTLRAGKDGWSKAGTTTCPCVTPKGRKAPAVCDAALP